jgi:DNA-binding protein H-NS
MKLNELERMSVDDLWQLNLEVGQALEVRLTAEKDALEQRLKQLRAKPFLERRIATSERRQYPPVSPKFRNPDDPSETWAGRGKQPRWLAEQLRAGKTMDDFRIEMAAEVASLP